MKRYEKKRLEQDRQIDKLLKTPDGQAHYWNQLKNECQSSSMISLLESTLHLPGDVIECGVYRGRSVTRIGRILAEQAAEKKFYACDSFEGFPGEMVGRVDVGLFRFRDEPLELLTLSACETARGDDRAGLGLSGMAVKAGAQSVLGSTVGGPAGIDAGESSVQEADREPSARHRIHVRGTRVDSQSSAVRILHVDRDPIIGRSVVNSDLDDDLRSHTVTEEQPVELRRVRVTASI